MQKNLKLKKYGNEPFKLALIHGGPGAAGYMMGIGKILSKKIGIIEPFQTETSIDKLVLELRRSIENYCKIPVILLGHSWGAWLSMIFAAQFPKYVEKLILVSTGPFEKKYMNTTQHIRFSRLSPKDKTVIFMLQEEILRSSNPDSVFLKIGKILSKTDTFSAISTENEIGEIDYNIFKNVWAEANNLRLKGELIEYIKKIKCPVSAIHGSYDPHPAIGVKDPLSKYLNDFQFYELEKCGHYPWNEKFAVDEFFEILGKEIP
jgi:pimeloyl-ACP methyl ester carboxylesterase